MQKQNKKNKQIEQTVHLDRDWHKQNEDIPNRGNTK